MALIKHHKIVAALPAQLEGNAIYYVRAAEGFDLYVTNGSGQIVAYPANKPKTDLIVTRDSLSVTIRSSTRSGSSGDAYLPVANGAANLAGLMSGADQSKLTGIEAGATKNATDAQLRDRSTHTGMVPVSAVSGLGTAALKDVVVNQNDATPDRVLTVGYAGLNKQSWGNAEVPADMNDVPSAQFGASRAGTTQNTPGNGSISGGWISAGRLEQERGQLFFDFANSGLHLRTRYTSTPGVWNSWRQLWDSESLKPTTYALDFSAGRVATVGFAGWGGTAPAIDPSTTAMTDQQSSLLYSTVGAGNPFPVATPAINVRGTRSMIWGARSSRAWVYTYGETPVLMELWTDKNFTPANYSTTVQMQAAIVAATTGTSILAEARTAFTLSTNFVLSGASYVRATAASAVTVTVPANSSQAIPIGAEITLRRVANANLTIVPASGVLVNPPPRGTYVLTQGMTVTLKKVAINEWDMIGETVLA